MFCVEAGLMSAAETGHNLLLKHVNFPLLRQGLAPSLILCICFVGNHYKVRGKNTDPHGKNKGRVGKKHTRAFSGEKMCLGPIGKKKYRGGANKKPASTGAQGVCSVARVVLKL